MASFESILSLLGDVEYKKSEEEQWERVLQKLKQQCFKERAKRQSLATKNLKIAIEKSKFSMRKMSFSFALSQVQNKSFTSFRSLLEENLKMQKKLVENIKSRDWELVNRMWRFKIKTLQEQKEKMIQHFRNQQDLWEMKMRLLPEFKDTQKTRTLFEEKQRKLLELEEQWKVRKEAVDNKYHRTNKHFEQINITLDSSEKIVADLKQEAEKLETEVKRLDASKLEEIRLIKDLENDLKKRAHIQTEEIAEENSKYYGRTRSTSFIGVFNLPPISLLKMEKMTAKTYIEDRKGSTPIISNTLEKLANFPEQIAEHLSQSEKSQLENTENIKLRPDKRIKILEHIILNRPGPCTTKGTVSEQKDSSLVVSVAGRLSCKTAEILNISQNKSPSDVQDLKQSNEATDERNLFDRQLMRQNVLYKTQMGEKDKNKTNQAKKVEYINVFEKNILKQEELKDEEKEKEQRTKIVTEDDKFQREENAGIADKMSMNETKSNNTPFLEIEGQPFPRHADYRQKIIKVGNIEADVNSEFEPQKFPVNKTSSDVKKRKSDKPFSEENLNAKQFKFKDSDSSSKSDFKPGQSSKVSVGDHLGSENNTDKIMRKAFEFCKIPENPDAKSEDTEINLNDDFESFFSNLMSIELHSKNQEKGSYHSSDDGSGWGAFGNNFKMGDNNNEDKGFFK